MHTLQMSHMIPQQLSFIISAWLAVNKHPAILLTEHEAGLSLLEKPS
jgi:hypothetical protein